MLDAETTTIGEGFVAYADFSSQMVEPSNQIPSSWWIGKGQDVIAWYTGVGDGASSFGSDVQDI
jgi:hypothetical protein